VTPYHHVFNFTSIDSLWSGEGLPLKFLNEDIMKLYNFSGPSAESNSCLVVTLFSLKFNSGKTTFLEKFLKKIFGSGHHIETKGLSGYRQDQFCFQEIMGFGKADKHSTDRHQSIARDFVLTRLSQVLIIVVNELTVGDIDYLLRFQTEMKTVNPDAHIIYIHNPYSYNNEEAMEILIQNDIVNGFDAKQYHWIDSTSNQTTVWWAGKTSNEVHLLFGNTSNALGQKYNRGTLNIVRNQLEMLKPRAKPFNLLQALEETIGNHSLPLLTVHPKLKDDHKPFLPSINPAHVVVQAAVKAPNAANADMTMWTRMTLQEVNKCEVYHNLSLSDFEVSHSAPIKQMDGSVVVPLKLANPATKFSDLRSGSSQASDLMFTVKHHVFITNASDLVMRFEVLDSKFNTTFENRKLIMTGCRIPPLFKVATMLTT
jgi:hypothetical protein